MCGGGGGGGGQKKTKRWEHREGVWGQRKKRETGRTGQWREMRGGGQGFFFFNGRKGVGGDVKGKNREKAGRVSWERMGGGGELGEEGGRGSWERKGGWRFGDSDSQSTPSVQ